MTSILAASCYAVGTPTPVREMGHIECSDLKSCWNTRLWECLGFLNNNILIGINDLPFVRLLQLAWRHQDWCILDTLEALIFFTNTRW